MCNIRKKNVCILLLLFLVFLPAMSIYYWQKHKINDLNKELNALYSELDNQDQLIGTYNTIYTSTKGIDIIVYNPLKNSRVTSPLMIIGEVPGNWSFEASFPIKMIDAKGEILSKTVARIIGNWTTPDLTPFVATLEFAPNQAIDGSLVLIKDNPSGLESNDDSVIIPIKF